MSEVTRGTGRRIRDVVTGHAPPLAVAVLFLLPLVWMVSAALRDPSLPPPRTVEWLPQPLTPGNFGAIFEMARLDGAGPFRVWWRIALPLAIPTTIAVAVLSFILYWSDFLSPLLYLRDQDLYTLPIGLRQLQQLDPSDWPLMMSGALLLTIPAVGFFLLLQHLFLSEDRLGSIRGR